MLIFFIAGIERLTTLKTLIVELSTVWDTDEGEETCLEIEAPCFDGLGMEALGIFGDPGEVGYSCRVKFDARKSQAQQAHALARA